MLKFSDIENWTIVRGPGEAERAAGVVGLVGAKADGTMVLPDGSSPVSGGGTGAPNSIVLLGDSITNNSNINNGLAGAANVTTQYKISDYGWFTWANIIAGSPFAVMSNSGVAGDTTGQMLDRLQSDVLDYSPAWVLVAGGINDILLGGASGLGYEYTVSNLSEIVSRCKAAGSKVILATILPNNTVNGLGAGNIKVENLLRVNDWIRRYCEETDGVYCLDVFSSILDQATLCGAVSGSFTDNTHPGTIGAHRIGTAAARMMSGWAVKQRPVIAALGGVASVTNPHGNLIRYAAVGGTGGTGSTTYTSSGTVPEGWWMQDSGAIANAGHTIVMSRPARSDYQAQSWWQAVVSWTAAQNTVATFTHRLLSASAMTIPAGIAAGDIIDCAIEVEYSGVVNAGALSFEFAARQGTTDVDTASFTSSGGSTTPTPAFSGVVSVGSFPLPAGADNIMVRVQARNLTTTTGGYTLRLGRVFVGKRL